MRKPRSRPRRIPTNRPRIDCSGASSQLWLSKISTSERVEDLGTLGGDCGTARRLVQGALKLILEPVFKLLFKRGRMDIDRNGQRIPNLFRSRLVKDWHRGP